MNLPIYFQPKEVLRVSPVSGQTYQNDLEFVEGLTSDMIEVERQLFEVTKKRDSLINVFDAMTSDVNKGTHRLEGTEHVVKIVKKENVNYQKQRGEKHPLSTLLEKYGPILKDKINIQYCESGQKIEKLIEELRDEAERGMSTEERQELLRELIKWRVVKPGKSQIEIEVKKS